MDTFERIHHQTLADLAPEVTAPDVNRRVAALARQILSPLQRPADGGDILSTMALACLILPPNKADKAVTAARKRLFRALQALAVTSLADCCTRGKVREINGRVSRPWLWHTPLDRNPEAKVAPTCPHCGGLL